MDRPSHDMGRLALAHRNSKSSNHHRKESRTSEEIAVPQGVSESLAPSTIAAYQKDIRLLAAAGLTIPTTAAQVLAFVDKMRRKLAPRTMHRRLTALRVLYPLTDPNEPDTYPFNDPTLRQVMTGLRAGAYPMSAKDARRRVGKVHKPDSAKPITRKLLHAMLDCMGIGGTDTRDAAILLLAFQAALRPAQIVNLNVQDLDFQEDVLFATIHSSAKRAGTGKRIAVPLLKGPLCAARAVQQWVQKSGRDLLPTDNPVPLFISFDHQGTATSERLRASWISRVVKARLKAAGVDPTKYSGDSLRRGRLLEAGGVA